MPSSRLATARSRPSATRFAVCNAVVAADAGKAFVDIVAANGQATILSELAPDQVFKATGRLDSHKSQGDGKWRLRFWADQIEPGESPTDQEVKP